MSLNTDAPRIAMQVARNILVASIQVDLGEDVIVRFRDDLLQRLHESGSHGVILDVSGLEVLDAEEFAALRRIITMTRIMGSECVLVGLRPGVVSALVEFGVDTAGLVTAVDLDAGFALLERDAAGPSSGEADGEAEDARDEDAAAPENSEDQR